MTTIFHAEISSRPIHVLVIGVGWYGKREADGSPGTPSTLLPALDGITQSVERVVQWWLRSEGRLLGRQLASIELLFSAPLHSSLPKYSDGSIIAGVDGSTIFPATIANVRDAFRLWVERCRRFIAGPAEDSLAILHWIGHGENAIDGYNNCISLFCEDDWQGSPEYVSLAPSLMELRRAGFAARTLCFVDACRAKRVEGRKKPRLAFDFPGEIDVSEGSVACFSLSDNAPKTFIRKEPENRCGFKGGTMITEAVLDAFDHYAAVQNGSSWLVRSDHLEGAINARLSWWSHYLPVPPTLQVMGAQVPRDLHIAKLIDPRCMVEIAKEEFVSTGNNSVTVAHLQKNDGPSCSHSHHRSTTSIPMMTSGSVFRADIDAGTWCAVPGDAEMEDPTITAAAHRIIRATPPTTGWSAR